MRGRWVAKNNPRDYGIAQSFGAGLRDWRTLLGTLHFAIWTVDTLSNTDLVTSRHILIGFFPFKKGKKPHFRLTCVVQKHPLCKIYWRTHSLMLTHCNGSWSSSARQIPFLLFATTAMRVGQWTSSLRPILFSCLWSYFNVSSEIMTYESGQWTVEKCWRAISRANI